MGKNQLIDYAGFVPLGGADYVIMLSDYPSLGPMVSSFEVPAKTTNRVRVEFMGKSRAFPGRNMSQSNELNVTLLLDRSSGTYQQLIALQDSFAESATGNIVGNTFSIKAIHYDTMGIEAIAFTFTECWLAEVGSYTLTAGESEIISVPCVFVFAKPSVLFTGLGSINQAVASIVSRLTGEVINVAGSSIDGLFDGLGISASLPGSDPTQIVSSITSSLTSFLGLTTQDLTNMGSVLNAARTTLNGVTSQNQALQSLVKNTENSVVTSAISGFKLGF